MARYDIYSRNQNLTVFRTVPYRYFFSVNPVWPGPSARFRGVQSSGTAFDAKALARGSGGFKALARPSMPRPWRAVSGCSKLWRGLRCQGPGARFRDVQSSGAAFDAKALARSSGMFKALARPSMPRPWRAVSGCSKLWRGLRCQGPGEQAQDKPTLRIEISYHFSPVRPRIRYY
ncbi:MAG: hypothetical protein GY862_01860 [Gammaproteobacteria bacterium]|nr:hypothetical protein [Gammaproteobacteria bacterium]